MSAVRHRMLPASLLKLVSESWGPKAWRGIGLTTSIPILHQRDTLWYFNRLFGMARPGLASAQRWTAILAWERP